MNYNIVEMSIDKYNEIYNSWSSIEGLCIEEDDSPDNLEVYLERNKNLNFIAFSQDEIVATIKCGHDGRRGYLHHLLVRKDFRGRGLAKEMINRVLQSLKEQGIKKCNTFVLDSNTAALDFWKYNDWKELKYDYRTLQKQTYARKSNCI